MVLLLLKCCYSNRMENIDWSKILFWTKKFHYLQNLFLSSKSADILETFWKSQGRVFLHKKYQLMTSLKSLYRPAKWNRFDVSTISIIHLVKFKTFEIRLLLLLNLISREIAVSFKKLFKLRLYFKTLLNNFRGLVKLEEKFKVCIYRV